MFKYLNNVVGFFERGFQSLKVIEKSSFKTKFFVNLKS
jgi:hypothetical protein